MERERLTRLLEDPAKVAREDLAGLRELTERYPWFSGAHLLRAMGEQALGEVLHDEALRTAAAHLPVRTALFDAAHAARTPAPVLRLVPSSPASPATVVDAVPDPEEHPTPSPTATDRSSAPPEEAPLDAEIRRSAMASSYELLVEHAPETAVSGAPSVPSPGPEAVELDAPQDRNQPEALPPERQETEPLEDEAAPKEIPGASKALRRARMPFTSWLDTARTSPDTAPPPNAATVQEDPATAATSAAPPETPVDSATLIDRFIRQSTPEARPKTAFFTPQQAGKRSLDDTAGLVTETLAKVYEKQGNLPKAIETYHKLASRYPDKSAYFAALAKAIEDQSTK